LRIIREEETPRPSTRLSTAEGLPTIAANRGTAPKKLAALFRGELDWIVLKALEKDRNRRYETANGFAADVQRYLADEPVLACPPSAPYRLRKFVRRHKGTLTAGALVALALVLGTAFSAWQAVRAGDALEAERATRATLDREREETEQQKSRVNRDLSDALVETAGLREKARAAGPGRGESWAGVREAAGRAHTLAAHELADPLLRQRAEALLAELKQDETNRRTEAQLEEARLDPESHFVGARESPVLAVLGESGLPIFDLAPEEAIQRIAASPIRDALVLALDHLSQRCHDRDDERRLLSIARKASDDPWRQKYFEARLQDNKAALRDLAGQPETLRQPPASVAYLIIALRQFDFEASERLFRLALVAYPDDLWMSWAVAQPGNYWFEPWEVGYRIALAMRPQSPRLYSALAGSLWGKGRYDEAIVCYDRAIRFGTRDVLVPAERALLRGRMLEQQGKPDDAIEAYKEGLRHPPVGDKGVDFRILDCLIDLLERQGAPAETIAQWLPAYAEAAAVGARGIGMSRKAGDVLARWGKPREAIDAYAADLVINSGPGDWSRETPMLELITKSGRLDETLATWRQKAAAAPGSYQVCLPLCVVLEKTGRQEECLATWGKWAKSKEAREKFSVKCWIRYGDALARANRLTEAAAAYRKGVELLPPAREGVVVPGAEAARRRLINLPAGGAHDPAVPADALQAKGDAPRAKGLRDAGIAPNPKVIELPQAEMKQDEKDRRMVTRLEEIRCQEVDLGGRPRAAGWRWPLYEAAFREYGLPLADLSDEEAGRRLQRSAISDWLVAAMDDGADNVVPLIERLLSIALQGEKDPWRRRYLEARIRNDLPGLVPLAKQPEALAQPPMILCMLARRMGLVDEPATIELLRAAQRRYPGDVGINFYLAVELLRVGYDATPEQPIRKFGDAVGYLRVALAGRPESQPIWVRLGLALWRNGDYEESAGVFREVIRLWPETHAAYVGLGDALLFSKNWDGAVTAYLKSVVVGSPTPHELASIYTQLGRALAGQGHLDEAITTLRKARTLAPDYNHSLRFLAQALRARGDLDEAIAAIRELIELSKNPWYLHELSEIQWEKGDYGAAITSQEKFIKEAQPNNVDAINNLAWWLATCPDVKFRDPARAVEHARKATQLAPNNGITWNTLGVAQYRAGDWKAAVFALEVSRGLRNGGDGFDWLFLAMTHRKLGDNDQARKFFDMAVAWREKNRQALQGNKAQEDELRRFQAEAEEVLELKK
jgi:tetratricopeptide (TPR) repeat protein